MHGQLVVDYKDGGAAPNRPVQDCDSIHAPSGYTELPALTSQESSSLAAGRS